MVAEVKFTFVSSSGFEYSYFWRLFPLRDDKISTNFFENWEAFQNMKSVDTNK